MTMTPYRQPGAIRANEKPKPSSGLMVIKNSTHVMLAPKPQPPHVCKIPGTLKIAFFRIFRGLKMGSLFRCSCGRTFIYIRVGQQKVGGLTSSHILGCKHKICKLYGQNCCQYWDEVDQKIWDEHA